MSVPNYHWYEAINDGLLHAGGPLRIKVTPVSYDMANGTKRPIAGPQDEIELILDPDSRPGTELLVSKAGYYASDGSRGNLVVHLRAAGPMTVGGAVKREPLGDGEPTTNVMRSAAERRNALMTQRREGVQGVLAKAIQMVDSPGGHVAGVVVGASSALSGVAAITDGGFGTMVSGVMMLILGGLIILGATDKEN